MAGNNGGPWGGGGNRGGSDNRGGGNSGGGGNGGGPGGDGPQIPEIDELMKKGQEQLRVLMGGRGGRSNGPGGGAGGGAGFSKSSIWIAALLAVALWIFASFYTVRPEEQSVELFLGEYSATGTPGLNFAPWPIVTAEVIPVTREQTEELGVGRGSGRGSDGLMLTTDENIVDIDFQVVWNINDPAKFLFNLADPTETIRSVSESAMREVIARSELAPILNRDRQAIADNVQDLIQATLDQYDSGVNVVRLNLDRADPPREVIDSFRDVQAAEQERDRLQRTADAYANRVLAGARGEAAQQLEQAEAYRAQVVNEAEGEASRFSAVLTEYSKAPDVTRKRLYLETMERVFGSVDKVILDDAVEGGGSSGVVPYLPLNELRRGGSN
ncbi:MAG: FtsH protease activity modulator HflK [Pseudomonadota bacterium]